MNPNEACSASRRQRLKPALSFPWSSPNHSLACFYFMPYFSLSGVIAGLQLWTASSLKLIGVEMREEFASFSQRGSQDIIMGRMQEPCVLCERIIAALSTAHP